MTTNEIIRRGNCTFWAGLRDIIAITVKQGNEELLNCLIAPAIWLPGDRHGQPDDPINGYIDLYEKIAHAIFDGADTIVLTKHSTGQVQYRIIEQITQTAIEGGKQNV
jgi:hypothetical protein